MRTTRPHRQLLWGSNQYNLSQTLFSRCFLLHSFTIPPYSLNFLIWVRTSLSWDNILFTTDSQSLNRCVLIVKYLKAFIWSDSATNIGGLVFTPDSSIMWGQGFQRSLNECAHAAFASTFQRRQLISHVIQNKRPPLQRDWTFVKMLRGRG